MARELYVGSISYKATEYDLEKLFTVAGRVTSIHLITDPVSGQFRGCAYVRMSSEAEAKEAITTLDGALLIDRVITVTESRPPKQRPAKAVPTGKPGQDRKPSATPRDGVKTKAPAGRPGGNARKKR